MKFISNSSLSETLDSVSDALFWSKPISANDRLSVAKWLAARQGLPGSYAKMFAPTPNEIQNGIKVFTGEKIVSGAAIRHILGEEACRILSILGVGDARVKDAHARAIDGIAERFVLAEDKGYDIGTYCCGKCSVSYWRNLLVTKIPKKEERIEKGMRELKKRRVGDGNWRAFPFYYTSLALVEIGTEFAKAEMRYAAQKWEKHIGRAQNRGCPYFQRREKIGEEILKVI